MKRLLIAVRLLTLCGALAALCLVLTASVFGQTPSQAQPSPTPRHALAKPSAESRGFEKFAGRDASARLIASAGTRMIMDPGDFYSNGEANYKAGKYEAAVKDLRQAVKQSPDWDDPHYVLALALTETGRLEEAIAEFKQVVHLALKDEPKILAYYNLGNTYFDLKQYPDAIESYKQAIKLNPKLSKPRNNLGLAYAASDQLAEAVAEFREAVDLRADYADAHFNLGVAYLQLDQKREAEEQRRILVPLSPALAEKLAALIKQ